MTLFADYHLSGDFYLDYFINSDGKIIDPTLHPDVSNPVFTNEVYRTLQRLSKNWSPALFHGIPVKSKISQHIHFSTNFRDR